jgi:hypothetical protein
MSLSTSRILLENIFTGKINMKKKYTTIQVDAKDNKITKIKLFMKSKMTLQHTIQQHKTTTTNSSNNFNSLRLNIVQQINVIVTQQEYVVKYIHKK